MDNLYGDDKSHPSVAGSYLVACDFFTAIFGYSPEGVDYHEGISKNVAETLQRASAALLTYTPDVDKPVIEEYKDPNGGGIKLGAHCFASVAADGNSNIFDTDKITLYVNGETFVTLTASGATFYDGTVVEGLTYTGANVQLGLVVCYADVTFSNIVITK